MFFADSQVAPRSWDRMRRTRIAALTAAGVLVAAGTGVAVATTTSDDAKEREAAVLADAAKRLDVEPSELRDALSDAENAQLDADVKAGRLTQEQADAIKRHREEAGTVLGPGRPFFHHGPGPALRFALPGGPVELFESAAGALGISRDELGERLRDGKSLEEIAKAEGKSLDDVRDAVEDSVRKQLDDAVDDGDLTRAQADKLLDGVGEMIERLGEGPRLFRGGPPFGFGHPAHPFELLDTAADALGISRDELEDRLRDGKTVEEIAKAEGKSLGDVRRAVEGKLEQQLDEAVDDGRLTREQADRLRSRMSGLLDDLGRFPLVRPGPPPWAGDARGAERGPWS
jgi:polyhydroxyalkanoate synthesis regulator phasin/tellurite resistance protein